MNTLTPAQGAFAARLFNTKGLTQSSIAKMLRVDVSTIAQTIRVQTGGRMDDVVDVSGLTDSQKRLVKVIQAQAKRIIDAELAEVAIPIRERMAAIIPRVDAQLATFAQRIDEGIERAEAAERKHVGMLL
jgi:hypothetical protein